MWTSANIDQRAWIRNMDWLNYHDLIFNRVVNLLCPKPDAAQFIAIPFSKANFCRWNRKTFRRIARGFPSSVQRKDLSCCRFSYKFVNGITTIR